MCLRVFNGKEFPSIITIGNQTDNFFYFFYFVLQLVLPPKEMHANREQYVITSHRIPVVLL